MSTQRWAILAAVSTNNMMRNTSYMSDSDKYNHPHGIKESSNAQQRPNGTHFHGNVNVLLGGYVNKTYINAHIAI